jgi:hypothetical protein
MKWLKILLAKSPPLYIINHKNIFFEGGLVRFMMNYIITKKFIPNYFFMNFMFCNYFFTITNSYGFRRGLVRFMERDIK